MDDVIAVVNAGSSSLKFSLFIERNKDLNFGCMVKSEDFIPTPGSKSTRPGN
jgi:acetate kinase